MKTKIFSAFFILFLCLAAVGAVNASADTYGDLTYTVSGNTIEITGCNKSAADVVIPPKIKGRTVTSIGEYAFSDCRVLTSITIPDSVTSIGDDAFGSCENLERVDITDLAAWCKISFKDRWSNPLFYAHNLYLNGELVENLVIPDGVESIGNYAFVCCNNLAKVTIPNSVTIMGKGAFDNCENIYSVNITDLAAWRNISFENSSANPLYYARNLYLNGELVENLVIPDSVTNIGNYAFYGCESLKSIMIPDSVTSIGTAAFWGCNNLNRVDITDIAAWYKIDFIDYFSNPLFYAHNLYLNGELVENLVIPDGITCIGDYAFLGCSGLTSVTIPDSVTSIGDYVFGDCRNLTSVIIPDSVTSIGESAFEDCNSLMNVTIPDSVTSIGAGAFSGCSDLTSVTIGSGVTSIGNYAFNACYDLMNVTIPDSVTSIGDSVFDDCRNLTSVTIPDGLNIIPKSAFSYCINLKAITIPASMEYIRNDAFSGCDNIKYVFFKGSRDFWDNEMLIYTGNDALNNAEIICGAKEKTYKFVTNCEKTLSPVTAYYIAGAPNTETLSRKKYITGWYDNPELSGVPVKFPYYSDKTTLYAKLADRTGKSFESAVYVPENGSSAITANDKYWIFVPEKTGEYIFKSTSDDGLYLYNSNKTQLASGSNSITFSLAAGEVYYINEYNNRSSYGTLTVTQADYKGTSTSISNNGKNIRVVPTDAETGTKITVALYNGDKFVGTKVATYQGGAIEFTTNTEYTTIKVMAWNADNLTPCAKAEVVER